MSGPQQLHTNRGRLRTRMGAVFVGERAVFRGHDLHADLHDMDWMALYVFGITGRRFTPGEIRLMHAIWTFTSYPDARLWNNRVAALAGTTRSTGNLGLAAALAVSEASTYGRGIDVEALDFLRRTRRALDAGESLEACVQAQLHTYRRIAGFGRPIADRDERIEPTMVLARALGLADGAHVRLAFDIEKFLLAGRWRMHMNYGALAAALAGDLGFSVQEYYLFMLLAFVAGMPPCFIEASEKPAGTFLPLACDDIRYAGPRKRRWTGSP
jgi:hypothetical protein